MIFSPLDEIIDKLGGPTCVAEMTGRRGRIVRLNNESKPRYQARESDSRSVDSLNIQEVWSIYTKIFLLQRSSPLRIEIGNNRRSVISFLEKQFYEW